MHVRNLLLSFASLMFALLCVLASGQSLVSGDVTGTITDPSGAVVPNATVSIINNATGQTQTATTNSSGAYRFSLLPPGGYTVNAAASGFQNSSRNITVVVGQASAVSLQLTVGSSSQTVEVSAE